MCSPNTSSLRRSVFFLALLCIGAFSTLPVSAARLLVHNALLVTMDGGTKEPFRGWFLVDNDGRIAALSPGDPPEGTTATATLDAKGKVVLPGFLSGHSHLWQSAFRGIAADQWVLGWISRLHRLYGPQVSLDDARAFTLHGALDYLRHGITTQYNYTWNPTNGHETLISQFEAEVAAGARFIFGYIVTPRPTLPASRKKFESFHRYLQAKPANPRFLKLSLSSSGVDFGPDYTRYEFELMREYNLDLQMHYLEAPNVQQRQRASFPAIKSAAGLSPKLVFAHFIQTDANIVAESGAAGVGMIWNPLSNGRLASGLADIPEYLKAGIKVGMGIDGQASADVSDPFENMRMGLYQIRMRYVSPSILQPYDVLRMHTLGTAEVLGVADQVGSLERGKFADFLLVAPSEMDTGPVFDLYATLVFACSVANLESVYVGGEEVVQRGKTLRHDFASITRDVRQRVDVVRERTAMVTVPTP